MDGRTIQGHASAAAPASFRGSLPSRAETREAWRRYVSTGALQRWSLRDHVYRAWERCHLLGANPRQGRAEALSVDATERLLSVRRGFIAAARPFMTALSRAAGIQRQAALLGDESGVLLDIIGDEETLHGPEPFPRLGALLSEEVSGANGVGTSLAERGYVELVGPEHFIGGFHVFTCQGVPVLGADGSLAGVISTSMRGVRASHRLRDILVCAAGGIEAELLRDRIEEDVRRVLSAATDAALVRLRDDIIQAFTSARVRLDIAARRTAENAGGDSTVALVMEAQHAIDRFREQGSLWRELVSTDAGAPQRVALDERARTIVALLQTEAHTRRVELLFERSSPVSVQADLRSLSRELLSALLSAIDAAAGGGSVRVSVRVDLVATEGVITIAAEPAPASTAGPRRSEVRRLLYKGAR